MDIPEQRFPYREEEFCAEFGSNWPTHRFLSATMTMKMRMTMEIPATIPAKIVFVWTTMTKIRMTRSFFGAASNGFVFVSVCGSFWCSGIRLVRFRHRYRYHYRRRLSPHLQNCLDPDQLHSRRDRRSFPTSDLFRLPMPEIQFPLETMRSCL